MICIASLELQFKEVLPVMVQSRLHRAKAIVHEDGNGHGEFDCILLQDMSVLACQKVGHDILDAEGVTCSN